jgi:dCMP deaminase
MIEQGTRLEIAPNTKTERWDRHMLRICLLHASMSKDPDTQVGAVVAGPDYGIRSVGFNGFPRGIEDADCRLHVKEVKLSLIVHAELNAILAAAQVGTVVGGCTLFLAATDKTSERWGGPPCTRCTVHIIQAGIKRVVAYTPKKGPSRWHADLAVARELLKEAGIEFKEYQP